MAQLDGSKGCFDRSPDSTKVHGSRPFVAYSTDDRLSGEFKLSSERDDTVAGLRKSPTRPLSGALVDTGRARAWRSVAVVAAPVGPPLRRSALAAHRFGSNITTRTGLQLVVV